MKKKPEKWLINCLMYQTMIFQVERKKSLNMLNTILQLVPMAQPNKECRMKFINMNWKVLNTQKLNMYLEDCFQKLLGLRITLNSLIPIQFSFHFMQSFEL